MVDGNNPSGGVAYQKPLHESMNPSVSSPSWDDSLKPGYPAKNTFSDIYSALRGPGKEAPRPLMGIKPPEGNLPPPHLRHTRASPENIVKTADLLGLGDISPKITNGEVFSKPKPKRNAEASDTADLVMGMRGTKTSISTNLCVGNRDSPPQTPKTIPPENRKQESAESRARRIENEINANEKLLSDMKATGYVPPHLRDVPETTPNPEDADKGSIPPHLRNPTNVRTNRGSCVPGSTNWLHLHENRGSPPARPSKVSVMLTPTSQHHRKAPKTAGNTLPHEFAKPTISAMPPTCHTSSQSLPQHPTKISSGTCEGYSRALQPTPFREPPKHVNTTTNSSNHRTEPRGRAPTPPPPPPSNISTAYHPLPPESPPPRPQTSCYSRDDNASSFSHQDSRSYYGRSSNGGDNRGSQFLLLDHQRARMMRSYTQYRAKPGYAPHDPRLPFEYMHKLNGTLGARFGAGSAVGSRSVSTYARVYSRPAKNMTSQGKRNGLAIPRYEHFGSYCSTEALGGVYEEEEDPEEDEEEEEGEGEEKEVEVEVEEEEEEERGRGSNGLACEAWQQPPVNVASENQQKPRSIVLSGLPRNQTLKQVSRVCKGTGAIENIQMSKKHRMALVTFVEASMAESFYESTDNRGITLIFQDDETQAIMRQQVFVGMNLEILPTDENIRHVIEVADGSRVLQVIGWGRNCLERLVGYDGEDEASYDELLMRLASRYIDSQERDRKVQDISWRENPRGYLEATFIFAGIKDAMIARYSMENEPKLEGCHIMFGRDPCVP